jgi:hypothetical protein
MSCSSSYTFYTCRAAYKKHGAPDQRPILSLILFTRAAPCTKRKGFPINSPFYLLCFLHVHCRIQKARGSRFTSYFISYTFYTRNATYKKQWAPDQNIIILFIHCNHRRMKRKGHLYIHPSSRYSSKTISILVYKLTIFYL